MRKGSNSNSSLSSRQERNLRERERRTQMKNLFARLLSLLPSFPFRVSSFSALDYAVAYIKQLQERLAQLTSRKQELLVLRGETGGMSASSGSTRATEIQISSSHSAVEINLVSGLNTNFQLPQIIRTVEDEGVEVTGASYSTRGDSIFYTIHSREISPRIGVEISRVMERLKELGF